mmetsp:Transcript_52777/g.152162  ORF Transcript_52777/g.152162 Transcript_52777/m.152162 type:complete len:147 (+) Transcript_52777:19-459(+)
MTDICDVTAIHNPCAFVSRNPDKIYVGSQPNDLKPYHWIQRQFSFAGGKYLEWYDSLPDGDRVELSAGILGGRRPVILRALGMISGMVTDPNLARKTLGLEVTVNMAAVNYVAYTGFGKEGVVTGAPLHSEFRAYSNMTNLYFWHK